MQRTRVALPEIASKLALRVGAPIAATLLAAMVFSTLPKATVPAERPAAELTSGGKFAARIPGAGPTDPASTDESQTVLPIMTGAMAQSAPPASTQVGWTDANPSAMPGTAQRAVKSRLRLPLRHNAHGSSEAVASASSQPAALISPEPRPAMASAVETAGPKAEAAVLPRLAASARSLWSMTASSGLSVLSRMVP